MAKFVFGFLFLASSIFSEKVKKVAPVEPTNSGNPFIEILTNPFILIVCVPFFAIFFTALYFKKKKDVVFFAGRADQINAGFAFGVPMLTYFLIPILFSKLFGMSENASKILGLVLALGLFALGMFYLVKNAIAFNEKNYGILTFVIFVKMFFGFLIGLGIFGAIMGFSRDLRYGDRQEAAMWKTVRAISVLILVIAGIFSTILTTSDEELEERYNVGETPEPVRIF